MDGAFIDLPGVRLWCVDSGGDGTPIVFLHANTGTSDSWAPQLSFFARTGYRVIAFDRRGSGRSTASVDGSPQPGSLSEDLEALAVSLRLQAFHLVAVAAGSFSALDYAAWKPGRVRSLVAGATMALLDEPEIRDFVARVRIEALRQPSLVASLELSAGYRGSEVAGMKRWQEIEATAHQPGLAAQPLRTPNTYAKLAQIEAPVLALAGGADLIAPPALMRLWAAHIRRVEFDVLAEAGHSIAWEDPAAFNDRVLAFIRAHDPTAP